MVILFGTSINKYDKLFCKKRHKSTESSISNCATDKNCDNLKATTKKKEIFLLLRLPYLGKYHFKLKKKSENSEVNSSPENFALV